jgi:hypothetical protein
MSIDYVDYYIICSPDVEAGDDDDCANIILKYSETLEANGDNKRNKIFCYFKTITINNYEYLIAFLLYKIMKYILLIVG